MSDAKPTILAIDDAEGVRRLLEVTLGKSQVVKTAPDAHSALAWAKLATPPDLVLLDTEPAGMSGYELCKALRAMPGFTEVPVIFLAERRDPQELVRGYSLGALDFLMKPLAAPVLLQRIRGHLEQLARERATGLRGAELRIARLVRAMQSHERSLGGNRAQRLSQYARALARAAGAREVAADLLAKAAPVHDVGKLALPTELLRNERALAGAEREQFERHAASGAEIIGEHDDALLKLARTLALTHHEYWDGSGFPGRLEGNQIPWAGRVMGIVDAFESTTAAQYGGSRMSTDKAVDEITAGAGTQFDPALIEALRKAAAEFRKVHGAYPERAADAGDDLVLGAASARSPAAKPAPAAAAADDLVLGAPARDPVDKGGLSKMAPPRPGAGAASSDKIREAIQRAAARAQRPAAPPPPEARPRAEEKPAAVPLDFQLGESAPPPGAGKLDERKRALETVAPAQKERAAAEAIAQARSPARGEFEALRARVSELEAELQEARGEAQIRMNELEATRAALTQARAELERVRERPVVEPPTSQGELQHAQAELESTKVALSAAHAELERARAQAVAASAASQGKLQQARAELEALNAQVAGFVNERTVADAALAGASTELQQAHAELERTRAEVAALRQSQAEFERLRSRIRELEAERSTTVAALLQARAEGERARAELRGRPVATQEPQWQAEFAGLRSQVKELETERAAAVAALLQARAEGEHARAEIAKLSDSAKQLEAELVRSDAARSDAHAQLEHAQAAQAQLEGLRNRVNELESEREQARAELEGLRARVNDLQMERAAADVTQEPRSAEAADAESRLAEIQRALDELQRRREDAEATLIALQARVADAQAELETQTERTRLAAEEAAAAPVAAVAPVAAPRPIATLLVVAFLFGALAMGITFLLFHP